MQICSGCETQMAQPWSKWGEPTLRRHGSFEAAWWCSTIRLWLTGEIHLFYGSVFFLMSIKCSGNPLCCGLRKQCFCHCFLQPSKELWALVDVVIYRTVCSVWMQWGSMLPMGRCAGLECCWDSLWGCCKMAGWSFLKQRAIGLIS